jgi:hypothetical protein
MGLQFTVGNPSDAFVEEYAGRVRSALKRRFGDAVVLDSPEPPYRSDECGWSGWSMLQTRAKLAVGEERIPHLLSMEAWRGCYVPADTNPGFFAFGREDLQLDVGSLPELVSELQTVGVALDLPLDDDALRELEAECTDDEDMDTQVYAALLLAARTALRRRQALWIVK